jgi:hypothetical protein
MNPGAAEFTIWPDQADAAESPASIPAAIFATSADVRINGGDRIILLPETRIITPAS